MAETLIGALRERASTVRDKIAAIAQGEISELADRKAELNWIEREIERLEFAEAPD